MTYIALRADYTKLRKVRKRLRRKGNEAYTPFLVSKRIVPKGLKIKRRRHITLLMSYVLVKVPEDREVFALWLHDVMSTKDVRDCIRSGEGPAHVPDHAVEELEKSVVKIRAQLASAGAKSQLRRGAKAVIKNGSLAGKAGKIAWLRGQRAGLEAKLFGAVRTITVSAKDLEAA